MTTNQTADAAPPRTSLLEFHEIADQKYAVQLSWEGDRPSWIDVRVAEACDCYDRNGAHSIMYAKKGLPHNSPETEDFEQAQRLFGLAVKWDHCAHWYFGEESEGRHGDGYNHTCDEGVGMLAAMKFAYDRAKKIMVDNGNWLT